MTDDNAALPATPEPAAAPATPGSEPRLDEVFASAVADKPLVSPLAKRAANFALIGVVVNVGSNLLNRALDAAFLSAAPAQQQLIGLLELALLIVSRLGLIVIIVFAVWYAVRAVPQTAAGSGYVGRGRVIATFILCGIFAAGLVVTTISLFFVY